MEKIKKKSKYPSPYKTTNNIHLHIFYIQELSYQFFQAEKFNQIILEWVKA